MCNVCVATNLDHGENSQVTSIYESHKYMLSGQCMGAIEGSPCKYRISKNGAWCDWIVTDQDLPDIVSKGGFDLSDDARTVEMDNWIEAHFKSN